MALKVLFASSLLVMLCACSPQHQGGTADSTDTTGPGNFVGPVGPTNQNGSAAGGSLGSGGGTEGTIGTGTGGGR